MFVKVGSARLFFDVVGEGLNAATSDVVQRPTLILLHGGPGPAMTIQRCAHILTVTATRIN